MALLVLVSLLGIYNPQNWRFYPSMDDVRCITASNSHVYFAVERGVYVFRRSNHRYVRCLTEADGIEGEVWLCAWNPARNDLYVATDGHLYRYIDATDRVAELSPPFEQAHSIGIVGGSVYFDTEKGLYRRQHGRPEFTQVNSAPDSTNWYGERDTLRPEDFTFLTPYYVTDEQFISHEMMLVYPDPRGRKLYVGLDRNGARVYNMRSGFSEHSYRLGPTGFDVDRIIGLDSRLWFLSNSVTVALDSDGVWTHRRTMTGDLPSAEFRLLLGSVLDLRRTEGLNAVLPDSLGLWLATDDGLYSLGLKNKLTSVLKLERSVNGLAQIGNRLVFGTDYGLFALSGESLVEIRDPFDRTGFGVFSIARTATGQTWLGTVGGLLRLDPDGEWEHIIPPGFDLSREVFGLAAGGDVVFYDDGDGITAWDSSDSLWHSIDASRGLPSGPVQALYADDRYLWIAAPGIISRLDYRAELGLED